MLSKAYLWLFAPLLLLIALSACVRNTPPPPVLPDLPAGWNSVVIDFSTLEFRSEKPGPEYEWVLPGSPPEPE